MKSQVAREEIKSILDKKSHLRSKPTKVGNRLQKAHYLVEKREATQTCHKSQGSNRFHGLQTFQNGGHQSGIKHN